MVTNYKLIFGIPESLPVLPVGWKYIPCDTDFLKAVDQAGTVYYVGEEYAYPTKPSPDGKALWAQTENPETWVRLTRRQYGA